LPVIKRRRFYPSKCQNAEDNVKNRRKTNQNHLQLANLI